LQYRQNRGRGIKPSDFTMAETELGANEPRGRAILVWDFPTRLFHWAIVALIAVAYATYLAGWMDWHARAGDAALTLVVFRLLWGFFGSDTSRFSRFVSAPRGAVTHLRRIFLREPDRQLGHNAAGGWMVLLLLALVLGEALSGIYVQNDVANDGPLTEITPARIANAITVAHSVLWDALLAAIALHILAIAVYAAAKGHDLVRPMITGTKLLPDAIAPPRIAPPIRAAALLAASAAAVAALATFL
jgi:cytochrome b